MKKYARICDGEVQELFSTDGDITQMFHPDIIWSDITDLEPEPVVGWSAVKSGDDWVLAPPVVVPPTDEEMKASAMQQRDFRLSIANDTTAGMADAFVADLLEPPDVAKFKAFAAYKLALNKIDKQPGYPGEIVWPDYPSNQ